MLTKVLVANRGEIAVRIVGACHELGISTVAVYSEPDRSAPHVSGADEAYEIGPAPAADSYLNGERLLAVAAESGCDAIHPGYGFLAENPDFARACEEAGFAFVGPSAETIALMGDKTEARSVMERAGVPVVPGTFEPVADIAAVRAFCRKIGYPILLKAAAGGGGKGMRRVDSEDEIDSAWTAAGREAEASFGDPRLYVEKYLQRPRHIEIQILADAHGNVIHLGERECSIQRRHQKLIEESPSPLPSLMMSEGEGLREKMGATAIAAARSAAYRSAGTVEFLVVDGEFYFLEMNTRLQVEHPVTEMVTGLDLVHAQLRIAAGEELALPLDAPTYSGHSIECRIIAEDPFDGFLPATGEVDELRIPGGPGVRWDGGIARGNEVSLYYDSLLAKLIVHAPDRDAAIARMARALDELVIDGVVHTGPLYRRIMDEPDFRAGELHTSYLEEHPQLFATDEQDESWRAIAVAAALLQDREQGQGRVRGNDEKPESGIDAWRRAVPSWPERGWGNRL